MTQATEPRARARTGFGFEAIMADPNYDRFPAWWAERCLLPSNPFQSDRPAPADAAAPLRSVA